MARLLNLESIYLYYYLNQWVLFWCWILFQWRISPIQLDSQWLHTLRHFLKFVLRYGLYKIWVRVHGHSSKCFKVSRMTQQLSRKYFHVHKYLLHIMKAAQDNISKKRHMCLASFVLCISGDTHNKQNYFNLF